MAKVVIDRELCMTSGQCTYMQPSVFRLDAEGVPQVLIDEVGDEHLAAVNDAIETCPSQAISLVE